MILRQYLFSAHNVLRNNAVWKCMLVWVHKQTLVSLSLAPSKNQGDEQKELVEGKREKSGLSSSETASETLVE